MQRTTGRKLDTNVLSTV